MKNKTTINNIIIASHRRSGTHLTIDSIMNNFRYIAKNQKNLYVLTKKNENKTNIEKSLSKSFIIKTHLTPEQIYNLSKFNQNILNKCKIIYVSRDEKDVLTSLYSYRKKLGESLSFHDFLRNKTRNGMNPIEYLKFHKNSWKKYSKSKILFITFEDLLSDYDKTLTIIEKFLDIPKNKKIVDVRKNKYTLLMRINRNLPLALQIKKNTTVLFNKGLKNSWKDVFSDQDLEFYNKYKEIH